MTYRVLRGDCIEKMRELADASIDAVVTDPPYSIGFLDHPWDTHQGREDAGFASWLAGFIDGEGCFTIKGHSRGTFAPSFRIKVRADDGGIVRVIHRTLGIGTVNEIAGSGGSHDQIAWTVSDKPGCQRLVDLLDKYPLRAKKRNDYLHWRAAVCEWTSRPRGNAWDGPADQSRMESLRTALMEGRRYTEVPWSGHGFQDWTRQWGEEALRVLKPGGHAVVFGAPRTFHRLTSGLEDAGFEVRDTLMWMFGQGFPKGTNISKSIDRRLGAEREVVGTLSTNKAMQGNGYGTGPGPGREDVDVTVSATDEARRWEGWNTALKPAYEPILLARKPPNGTTTDSVMTHGTGALNIDGCRIEHRGPDGGWGAKQNQEMGYGGGNDHADFRTEKHEGGRWPATVLCDEKAAAVIDAEAGERGGGFGIRGDLRSALHGSGYMSGIGNAMTGTEVGYGDSGGPARFFFQPRPDGAMIDACEPASTAVPNSDRPEGPNASAGELAPAERLRNDEGRRIRSGESVSPCTPISGMADGSDRIARLKYTPKTSTSERNAGLSPDRTPAEPHQHYGDLDSGEYGTKAGTKELLNPHPTVKPIDLMRWLCRLVTPPSVLDCPRCDTVFHGHAPQEEADGTVRGVREDVRGGGEVGPASDEVLQPDVREPLRESDAGDHEGLHDDGQGLPDAAEAGASDGEQGRVRHGASSARGGGDRSRPAADRGGASPERDQVGQPAGEPGVDGEAGARSAAEASGAADHVPSLLGEDRGNGSCARCGSGLIRRPGRILDPFLGSGSTGCGAVVEGFSFVGCERDPEYADIAEERVAWWSKREGADTQAAVVAATAERATAASGQLGMEL